MRPLNDQFGFEHNTWNPLLEFARGVGGFLAGHGEPYRIEFVGDGKPVAGLFIVHSVPPQSEQLSRALLLKVYSEAGGTG